MAGKRANIDFTRCTADTCAQEFGSCPAIPACLHKLLEQEDIDDPPMLISATMCVGCGDCVRACAPGAITIEYK